MRIRDIASAATPRSRADVCRRDFVKMGLSALAAPALAGCTRLTQGPRTIVSPRLTARPGTPNANPTLGLSPLGLASGRDGILYVPQTYTPDTPLPLFVGLHGAGQSSAFWASYPGRAETLKMIFMAPDSRGFTWDAAQGAFGDDVGFVDRALEYTFEHCNVDPAHVALGGFSDGATTALSLGLANGDLFTHVVAYSPGFILSAGSFVGRPGVFVSHGTQDPVISVSNSRDGIVPYLQSAGYDVVYQEFEGGHEVPASISDAALAWFLGLPVPPQQ